LYATKNAFFPDDSVWLKLEKLAVARCPVVAKGAGIFWRRVMTMIRMAERTRFRPCNEWGATKHARLIRQSSIKKLFQSFGRKTEVETAESSSDDRSGGQDSLFPEVHVHSYGILSEWYPVKSCLSNKRNEIVFCCVLSDEVRIYEDLVWGAINPEDSEKHRYRSGGLYKDCGITMTPPSESIKSHRHHFSWTKWRETNICALNRTN
jgi:hypothetical protein